jgi:hypothetical protein
MFKKLKTLVLALLAVVCLVSVLGYTSSGNTALAAGDIIEVPSEAFYYESGKLAGITKEWFRANCPDNNKDNPAYLKITIPSNVTSIASNAFCVNAANGDNIERYKYIHPSNYEIVSIDFSQASQLTEIGSQAFMYRDELTGVLTLPDSLTVLGKSAFNGCSGLTGVYLPSGLKELGSSSGGSVFKSCSGLMFVRVKGSSGSASIELPEGLEQIGLDTFSGALTGADPTPVTIPASVTYIGDSAFETYAATTITVLTDNASGYHGKSFITPNNDHYGPDGRMTVFKDSASFNTFTPSGLSSYKNSLTYEFTLQFGAEAGAYTEKKLYNQTPVWVKSQDGSGWYNDPDYSLPPVSGDAQPGYEYTWQVDGEALTVSTKLKPTGDLLIVEKGEVLLNPTVKITVDGALSDYSGSGAQVNVSNDKEHMIGVEVDHPLLNERDSSGGYVYFKYEWTDVWKGGSEGPRMEEDGFGFPSFPSRGTPVIGVSGPEDERTSAGDYSQEDYGDGYYLVEIYGYYQPSGGKPAQLFYKSRHTQIGVSDPQATVDTAYIFYVKTSDPAQIPQAEIKDISLAYGYDSGDFTAELTQVSGHTYSFQWYTADSEGQTEGGEKINGAVSDRLSIEPGKDTGKYYYYLEITSLKEENGDTALAVIPCTLTVTQAEIKVTPDQGQKKYTGQSDPDYTYTASGLPQGMEVEGALSRQPGEEAGDYEYQLGTLHVSDPNYTLVLDTESPKFEIVKYTAEAIFSPAHPDGENGWYRSDVTAAPPPGHLISLDGVNWSDKPIVLTDMDGEFNYQLKSIMDDETKDAIAENTKHIKIDTTAPLISGIEEDGVYCIKAEFTVADLNLDSILIDGSEPDGSVYPYELSPGTHTVTAADEAGNSVSVTVTVNESHTPGKLIVDKDPTCTESGTGHKDCTVCGQAAQSDIEIDALGHSFGQWQEVKAPTCTEKGLEERECTVCGFKETRDIDPLGHDWESGYTVDKEPTDTEPGSKSIHCTRCGAVKDQTAIPALGSSPQTRDRNNLPLWISMLLVSCTGAFVTAVYGRKNKNVK